MPARFLSNWAKHAIAPNMLRLAGERLRKQLRSCGDRHIGSGMTTTNPRRHSEGEIDFRDRRTHPVANRAALVASVARILHGSLE